MSTPGTDLVKYVPPAEPEQNTVVDLHGKVVEQNAEMIEQLNLIGKAPSPNLFTTCTLETIVDLICQSPQELQLFQFACDKKLNQKLREAIEHFAEKLVVPEGTIQ